jgi:V8-like Glu-specific endopeptidase
MKSVWIAYALFNAGILVAAIGTVLGNQAVLTAAHCCYAAGAISFAKHAWPRIKSLPQDQERPNARPP